MTVCCRECPILKYPQPGDDSICGLGYPVFYSHVTTWCHSSGCRLGEIITEDKLLIPGRDGMTSIPNTGKVQIGPNLNDVARPTLEEVRAMVWGEKLSRTNG